MKMPTFVSKALIAITLLLSGAAYSTAWSQMQGQSGPEREKDGVRNIVLVHGAWADGSSWSTVIPILEARGYNVVAAQLPLTSLLDDDAAVERAIERITQTTPGPVLLVGHSYAGVVIGDVPGNDARVSGLVYVAAFAPDSGQSALSLLGSLKAPPPIGEYLVFNADKTFVWIAPEGIARAFAQDLSPAEQLQLSVTQGIASTSDLLATPTVTPAWKSKPSWFIVSEHDDVVTAGLEEKEATILHAETIFLPTCHVAMLQEPERVASFIEHAAQSLNTR